MTDIHPRAILILSAAVLCALGAPGSAQPWSALSSKPRPDLAKRTKLAVKCLPPGSSAGTTTCATMRRGTSLLITVNDDIAGTAILRFKAKGVEIDRPIGPLRRGQAVRVAVPAELCSGAAAGQFEIQHLMSEYNQSESPGHADSVGFFQMRCD
jgi:hypothetical protein